MRETIEDAIALYRAGERERAADVCQRILAGRPDDHQALHLRSVVAAEQRNLGLAKSLIERAIGHDDRVPAYHHHRAMLLVDQGRLDDALGAFERAARLAPDDPAIRVNLGATLQSLGRLDEALAAYDRALQLRPDHALAHNNRGVVLQHRGRLDEALAAFDAALRIDPGDARGHLNRSSLLDQLGRYEEALTAADHALAYDPWSAAAFNNRGVALQRLGRLSEALRAHARALEMNPDLADAHLNRAAILRRQNRLQEALAACRDATRNAPRSAEAHLNHGVVLQALGRLREALAAYHQALAIRPDYAEAHGNRGNALENQGEFAEARAAYREALRLKPDYTIAESNALFCANFDPSLDEAALFEAHREWGERRQATAPASRRHANAPLPERPLRVGLVSSEFGRAPVGYFLQPVLAATAAGEISFVCYSGRVQEDDLTDRLRRDTAGWRSTLGVDDDDLAETIRADGIDILIDLAGHGAGNRLGVFARKPAPVQVGWLGYPCTTGLPAIDHSLMDEAAVPAGAERWFVEAVVRLPETRFCYAPPAYAPEPAPPPMLERGHITFGSFNNLAKVTPEVMALWAAVLDAVPGSRLLLKWKTLGDADEQARRRRQLEALGIAPERLELRGPSAHAEMLGEYADIDVALDPFPYCGGLTSLEALWQGVPVVTLPATRPVSRQTLGFLRVLGLDRLAAREAADYVAIAARLAADPTQLAALRRDQRDRMAGSPLCDGRRFAHHLETALRTMWRAWCATRTGRRPAPTTLRLDGTAAAAFRDPVHAAATLP